MKIKLLQKGFNFSQDGPGNRLVYHLQGCNFRCPWCSNPESMAVAGVVLSNGKPSCSEVEVSELVDEAKRSEPMFFGGGGVTLTGGEPTVQFDAVKELLSRLKAENIHTALETNGSHKRLPELFELVDFLIMDCKHYSPLKHRETIGAENETVLENLALAATRRSQLLVRIPLIGGFNASEDDARGFAELFCGFNAPLCEFELLRYHEYGKDKWKQCGLEYKMTDAAVSDEAYAAFTEILKQHRLRLVRT